MWMTSLRSNESNMPTLFFNAWKMFQRLGKMVKNYCRHNLNYCPTGLRQDSGSGGIARKVKERVLTRRDILVPVSLHEKHVAPASICRLGVCRFLKTWRMSRTYRLSLFVLSDNGASLLSCCVVQNFQVAPLSNPLY